MTSLKEVADCIGARLTGSGETIITGVGPIESAQPGEITFLNQPEYIRFLSESKAAAVIVNKPLEDCPIAQLTHKNPYWAFAKAAQIFARAEQFLEAPAISSHAIIDSSARLGQDVTVMPYAVIGPEVTLGDRVIVGPGCYLHRGTSVGADSHLWAYVVTQRAVKIGERSIIHSGAVIGADGFGFAAGDDGHAKIPQSGSVVIGDDVEIGANSTVDCGTMAPTVIGNGTKLDSHAHVAHNVQLGDHCILCGMGAVAGSAKLGDWVTVGGNSCVNNHVEVASGVTLGGHSAITKSIDKAGLYLGFPAVEAAEWRKMTARIRRLSQLEERVRELEKKS